MSREPHILAGEPADLAAEYALGVLNAQAHRVAEARALADPAFAAEAAAWSERLAPLLDEIALESPSPGLWPKILARLGASAQSGDVASPFDRAAARDTAVLRRRLAAWRATALSALAASLALAVALGVTLSRPPPKPAMLVAELKLERSATPVFAAYDPSRRAVLISLTGAPAPSGRSPQLWLIDPAGVPHPLGLLKVNGVAMIVLRVEAAARVQPASTLAISIEPLGGSPTGLPTGPVMAKGALTPA